MQKCQWSGRPTITTSERRTSKRRPDALGIPGREVEPRDWPNANPYDSGRGQQARSLDLRPFPRESTYGSSRSAGRLGRVRRAETVRGRSECSAFELGLSTAQAQALQQIAFDGFASSMPLAPTPRRRPPAIAALSRALASTECSSHGRRRAACGLIESTPCYHLRANFSHSHGTRPDPHPPSSSLQERAVALRGAFDYDAKREQLELEDPNVWCRAGARAEPAAAEAVVGTLRRIDKTLGEAAGAGSTAARRA